jgi:two-component system, chemotaxis family, response regulator Rcp1
MSARLHVLLVEDNPADADLTREGFASSSLVVELAVATSGTEAVDYVRKRGRHNAASRPDLILLDLNLPGIDGRAVLKEIKQDEQLRRIPVSMLSSSKAERDICQSYDLGANCYIVKPIDFKSFQTLIRTLEQFWFSAVVLPGKPDSDAAKAPVK